MMNLHIENPLAARRRATREALSPQKHYQPVNAGHQPDYSTWVGSCPPAHTILSATGTGVFDTMLPSLISASTEIVIDFSRPAEEDGRVLRSQRLHSGALADLSSPRSRSSSSVGPTKPAVAGVSVSFAEVSAQSSGEEGDALDKLVRGEDSENEEKDEGKEGRGRRLADPDTPLAKRRRTQSGDATAASRKRVRLPNETRKVQNRTNQRAFRARKDTYVSNLEVEHRQLLQLVENQKIELKHGRDLIKNLQEVTKQKRSRNYSSSTESSLEEETYPKNGLMDSVSQATLESDASGSPWSLTYSQPSTGDSDLEGILNDFVLKSPMPTSDMIVGETWLTEPDLAWAWPR